MTVSVYFYTPRRDSLYISLDGVSRKATVKIKPLRLIKVQVIQKIASDTKISQEIGGNDDDYRFFLYIRSHTMLPRNKRFRFKKS